MRYVDEFRDRTIAKGLAAAIAAGVSGAKRRYRFMEVCGTHTMNIFRFGIRGMLPDAIELLSGPGCPVCVTPADYIDKAVALARSGDVTVATFGDMMKVPGSSSSLWEEKARGRDVRVVYSTLDALEMAAAHPARQVVFLGVGFETTAPTVASSLIEAKRCGIRNYSVLSAHKTIPNALRALVEEKATTRIDGFVLPAHVSAIIGCRPYDFLAKKYRKRCVITGFEPLDILQGILMLVGQRPPKVEVQYTRVVRPEGNRTAQRMIDEVFEETATRWRGLGEIPASGLRIRAPYAGFDAEKRFTLRACRTKEPKGCICGAVLKGVKAPPDCRLFGTRCRPEKAVGPCMVSSEGTCAAYFKYRVG